MFRPVNLYRLYMPLELLQSEGFPWKRGGNIPANAPVTWLTELNGKAAADSARYKRYPREKVYRRRPGVGGTRLRSQGSSAPYA